MKASSLIFIFLLIFNSCENKQAIAPLYITTTTATSPNGEIEKKMVTSQVDSDYFEVSLSELADKAEFIATKDLVKATSSKDFKYVFLEVTNKEGEAYHFATSTDFLNFMSERGFQLIDQKKTKFGGDYTFQRK